MCRLLLLLPSSCSRPTKAAQTAATGGGPDWHDRLPVVPGGRRVWVQRHPVAVCVRGGHLPLRPEHHLGWVLAVGSGRCFSSRTLLRRLSSTQLPSYPFTRLQSSRAPPPSTPSTPSATCRRASSLCTAAWMPWTRSSGRWAAWAALGAAAHTCTPATWLLAAAAALARLPSCAVTATRLVQNTELGEVAWMFWILLILLLVSRAVFVVSGTAG